MLGAGVRQREGNSHLIFLPWRRLAESRLFPNLAPSQSPQIKCLITFFSPKSFKTSVGKDSELQSKGAFISCPPYGNPKTYLSNPPVPPQSFDSLPTKHSHWIFLWNIQGMSGSLESLTGSDLASSSEFQKGTAKYMRLFSLYTLPRNISTSGNLACLLLEARNMTNIQISQWN